MAFWADLATRRGFLQGAGKAGLAAAAVSLAGCVPHDDEDDGEGPPTPTPTPGQTDTNVLNFALNLEYLEAEFYARAVGTPFSEIGSNPGEVVAYDGPANLSPLIRQYAEELAADEIGHVRFLRNVLGGAAISRPAINLREAFTAAAIAAGVITVGQELNPFANDVNFLLAGFLFEDVGVTAYKGAAPLLNNPDIVEAGAGIAAVEGYHAGLLRSSLYREGEQAQTNANPISNARDLLDGPEELDQGIAFAGRPNIVPTDEFGIPFSRTTQQVLRIVYLNPLGGVEGGGFLPNGARGAFRTT